MYKCSLTNFRLQYVGYTPGYVTNTSFYDPSGTSTLVYTTTISSATGCTDGMTAGSRDQMISSMD